MAALFACGFLLATCCYGGGLPLRESSPLSFAQVWQSQFFFAGSVTAADGVRPRLPALSEWEGESTLLGWDVAISRDDQGPVFVRTSLDGNGEVQGAVTPLTARPVANLALTPLDSETVRVLIYSTHSGEGYSDGGSVLEMGAYLAQTLKENYGIGALADGTVHDSPEWYNSYANSRKTAERLLAEHPEAELLIDLHRDSGPAKGDVTMQVDGKAAARLLLVVGSDTKYEHKNWRQNYDTAQAVAAALDATTPELLRATRVQAGRYNQQLTAKAILIELGANVNTEAEARHSVTRIAAALAHYLDV